MLDYDAFPSNNDHIPGDLETLTQNGATWTYRYDSDNLRLLSESHPIGGTAAERILARQYDSLGRPAGFQLGVTADPDADHATTYDYDNAGRLADVTSPAGAFTYGFVNQAPHLIATISGPSDMFVTNQWKADRDVLHWKKNEVDSTPVSQFTYGVNPIGQRENVVTTGTAFDNNNRGWQWGYDALGQATKAEHAADNTLDRSYAYDSIGNRLQSGTGVSPAAITTYTPNLLNQYTSIENPQSSIVNPVHDLDGNLREDAGINALSYGLKYEWDAENRITAVRKADDTLLATYTYDPFSRRIRKTTTADAYQGASDTAYLYEGWNVIAEYDVSSQNPENFQLKTSYTWGLDISGTLQGAGGVGGLLAVSQITNNSITNNHYPTYDGNGNISEYIKDDGTTAAHFEYDPFGRLVYSTGTPSLFTYRFSTKTQDFETGLFYYGYRWYDPVTGRWPSRDPIQERGGVNLYGFVRNNPGVWIDILGLKINFHGTPEQIKKMKDQIEALKKCDPEGLGKMIQELEDSDYEHDIYPIEDIKKVFDIDNPQPSDAAAQNKSTGPHNMNDDKNGKGIGSDVFYDPDNPAITKQDGKMAPESVLAHELQHASDIDKGIMDREPNKNGVPRSEERAVRTQNRAGPHFGDEPRKTFAGRPVENYQGNYSPFAP